MKEQEVDKLIQDALKEDMKLPEGLSERLEKHIDRITSEKTPKSIQKHLRLSTIMLRAGSIAASLLLCIGIYNWLEKQRTPKSTELLTDTFTDPADAERALEKTFLYISEKMEKGFKETEKVQQKLGKTKETINDILNPSL